MTKHGKVDQKNSPLKIQFMIEAIFNTHKKVNKKVS
jgi:hypothetical protein